MQTHIGGEPSIDDLRNQIAYDVTVDGKMSAASIKACKRLWASYVREATNGKYRGVIQGYNNHTDVNGKHVEGPDGGEPWISGDLRDTWTMCVVDKKGKIVAWGTYNPTPDDDGAYYNDQELAEEVAEGKTSLADAKRAAQEFSQYRPETELESDLDANRYWELFKGLK